MCELVNENEVRAALITTEIKNFGATDQETKPCHPRTVFGLMVAVIVVFEL